MNELMKQIDDYMDYYNWGAMQFENKKLGPVYIQNPAYAERLNRLLWVPKIEGQLNPTPDVQTTLSLFQSTFSRQLIQPFTLFAGGNVDVFHLRVGGEHHFVGFAADA